MLSDNHIAHFFVITIIMKVLKRDGSHQLVALGKVQQRIQSLIDGSPPLIPSLSQCIDAAAIALSTVTGLYDGVSTAELDELAAQTAAARTAQDPEYGDLAARISISNLHKMTLPTFSGSVQRLSSMTHTITGATSSVLSPSFTDFVAANAEIIDAAIKPERDFLFSYIGFKTLEKAYLLKDAHGNIMERPSYMFMRVALAINLGNLCDAFECYELISSLKYTHATPTLFNAGTNMPQMSSCFLLSMDDSIVGIYSTLLKCAQISKYAGGIGIAISDIRAAGSYINGTGGTANGIVPMLRVFNNSARYIDQVRSRSTPLVTKFLSLNHFVFTHFLNLTLHSAGWEAPRLYGHVFGGLAR